MYSQKISRTEVLNKMGHVFERYRFLMRSKSMKQDQIQTIDYHMTEIMKVLNDC